MGLGLFNTPLGQVGMSFLGPSLFRLLLKFVIATMLLGSWIHVGVSALAASGLVSIASCEVTVSHLRTTSLGTDPEGSERLNGLSFQQDALVSFNGWYDPQTTQPHDI